MILVVYYVKRPVQVPELPQSNDIVHPSKRDQADTRDRRKINSHASTNLVSRERTSNGTTSLVPRKEKGEEMQEVLTKLNDVPIVFYGKLEDQFGDPVAGAEITGGILRDNGYISDVREIKTVSDDAGGFHFNDGKGESLSVTPRKPGYAIASTNAAFKYSHFYPEVRHIPDPTHPAVIKMWKLQGAEPLMKIDQRYKFHFTDMPVYFDLIAGKIVPSGGDIKVTVGRSPGIVSERSLQDWSVKIEVTDGGFIETSMAEFRVTYLAPNNGYQPSDNFIMSTNPPHKWSGGFDRLLFITSRHDQVYGKVNFGISINQNPDDYIWVEFRGIANTNSSRNWEGDPNTFKPSE